jgi:hypothetical protein
MQPIGSEATEVSNAKIMQFFVCWNMRQWYRHHELSTAQYIMVTILYFFYPNPHGWGQAKKIAFILLKNENKSGMPLPNYFFIKLKNASQNTFSNIFLLQGFSIKT